jgi:hypothetical protein
VREPGSLDRQGKGCGVGLRFEEALEEKNFELDTVGKHARRNVASLMPSLWKMKLNVRVGITGCDGNLRYKQVFTAKSIIKIPWTLCSYTNISQFYERWCATLSSHVYI